MFSPNTRVTTFLSKKFGYNLGFRLSYLAYPKMNKLCYYTFIVFGSSFGSASPSSITEDWDGGVMTLFNTFFQMETVIISSIFSVIAIDNNTTIIHLSLSLCVRFSHCVYYTYQNNHASLADNSGNKNNNNEKKTKVKVLKHTKWFSYVFSSSVFVLLFISLALLLGWWPFCFPFPFIVLSRWASSLLLHYREPTTLTVYNCSPVSQSISQTDVWGRDMDG